MDVDAAQKKWELENNIQTLPSCDDIFRYDAEQQRQIIDAKPWEKDPHYFKDIKISALALLKMVMHARSGGTLEIMGLMLGKVEDNTMVVRIFTSSDCPTVRLLQHEINLIADCDGRICASR